MKGLERHAHTFGFIRVDGIEGNESSAKDLQIIIIKFKLDSIPEQIDAKLRRTRF